MEHKDFYSVGKERKELRHEVLGEAGVSAHELFARGALSEEEFSMEVASGNIVGVANNPIVSPETKAKLSKITELSEEAKVFRMDNEEQRHAYESARKADYATKLETVSESAPEQDEEKRKIFRELDLMDEFLSGQKRGEYLATRHPHDPRLKDRLRRNARLEEVFATRRASLEVDPDTRFLVREHELDVYGRQIEESHYVITPSRREYISRIESLVNQGKPILLEGHTGTGKSELARIAAKELTGADPEVVSCNPATRQSDIFGKQSLRETEKGATVTGTDFGPLVRALSEGRLVIFDEFNELDPRQRQVLKYLYNARPGDMVDVPGDGKVRVEEGFGIIMTANLKSEKYKEKGELEPQEARVFQDSTIRVKYPEPDELYDIALSALSDTKGSVMLTKAEAEMTLRHFIDAVADIQAAYTDAIPGSFGKDTDFTGMTKGRKKRPTLEKYVLDTGMVARLLTGFHIARMKYGTPLRAFIDESLARTFEGDRVSEDDKKLAIFILAKHGFLKSGDTLKTLDLDYSDGRLDPNIFPEIKEDALDPARSLAELSASEVATLDPYGKRKISVKDAMEEFGVEIPEAESAGVEDESSFAEAQEMFKENFLGPGEIENAFGFKPDTKDTPPIPFSKKELEAAAKRGEMLVLNWDETKEGESLTIEQMAKLTLTRFLGGNIIEKNPDGTPKRHLLYNDQFEQDGSIKTGAWFKNDQNMLHATPKRGWQLVSPDIIPDSTDKNYLDQTQILVDHIRQTFPGHTFPKGSIEANAEEEWNRERPKIQKLLDADKWQDASNILSTLKISTLFREPFGNTLFRYLVAFKKGKQLFTDGKYSWSDTVDSGGRLASFGRADATGASVIRLSSGNAGVYLGVVSSRRKL